MATEDGGQEAHSQPWVWPGNIEAEPLHSAGEGDYSVGVQPTPSQLRSSRPQLGDYLSRGEPASSQHTGGDSPLAKSVPREDTHSTEL